ncbi:uncharacterized protein LOC130693748 [Daphnia carinata]|uniref:uncharacterized protein LOC130693748 n=1 Tax=Daphnia carinata TaxID=120202 RepID=UPI00257E63B6|nr:uncharacterized protein LOC130693748 [Daphnia carinata]
MGDFNETFLYHYTNVYAYSKILRDEKILKSSKDRDGTNHRYGSGVYLTSLKPNTGRGKIKKNNLDGVAHKRKYANKTQECYFKFKKIDLLGVKYVSTKGGRDVWRFPNDINLSTISFYHGYTDEPESETYQPKDSSSDFYYYDDYEDYSFSYPHPKGNYVFEPPRKRQESETTGLGFIAGTVAVLAVGIAAFRLFAAVRRAN